MNKHAMHAQTDNYVLCMQFWNQHAQLRTPELLTCLTSIYLPLWGLKLCCYIIIIVIIPGSNWGLHVLQYATLQRAGKRARV